MTHGQSISNCFNTTLKVIKTWGYPAGSYMCKVNNRNTRTRCQICLKLTVKTPEQRWIYDPLKYDETLLQNYQLALICVKGK